MWDGRVYVGTEADTVYALSAATGAVLWSRHLGTPVPAGALPCGDITPAVGITATMVLDPARATLYASAEELTGTTVTHQLVALDAATGTPRWERRLDRPGWDAAAQLQRAALALDAGSVVVGFGGNAGDCGDYHGWLVSVPESGTGPLAAYRVPTSRGGAIWAPAGVSVDPASSTVFAATGNGAAGPGQPFDHGDAVLALGPALQLQGFFAPRRWAQDNVADADLGSTAPVLLGGGLLVQAGKAGVAYLLHRGALGGIGGEVASHAVCPTIGGLAADGNLLLVPCTASGGLDALRVGPSTLTAAGSWHAPSGRIGSPTVAGGRVWVVRLGPSPVLYGVDPASAATVAQVALQIGTAEHFTAVAAAAGLLVVAGAQAVEALR